MNPLPLSLRSLGWVIHLADFTFVCPTELEDLENRYADFKAAGCEIYSVSCDTHFGHKAWHDHSERIGKITYPMLADPTHALEKDFDALIEADGKAERPAARASVHKVVDSGTDSGEGSGVQGRLDFYPMRSDSSFPVSLPKWRNH